MEGWITKQCLNFTVVRCCQRSQSLPPNNLVSLDVFDCLHLCQPDYEQAACTHMFIYLHCGCAWFRTCDGVPSVSSCASQSWSSLPFLTAAVVGFRCPSEGPLARWERCWRQPGPAALLPSPSAGCQAQHVQLARGAWRLAAACVTFEQGRGSLPNPYIRDGLIARARTHAHLHKADSWWVPQMFARCCRVAGKCVRSHLSEFVQERNITRRKRKHLRCYIWTQNAAEDHGDVTRLWTGAHSANLAFTQETFFSNKK